MNIFIFENYTLKYLWVKKHNVCNLLLYGSEKNKMYIERERKKGRKKRGREGRRKKEQKEGRRKKGNYQIMLTRKKKTEHRMEE